MEEMGLPSFGLSAGPSAADASSGVGGAHTGDFFFKQQKQGLVQQLAPFALIVGIVWLMKKK